MVDSRDVPSGNGADPAESPNRPERGERSIDSADVLDGARAAPPGLAGLARRIDGQSGAAYWRTLDELAGTPEFESYLHREFPENASQWLGDGRRSFLKLMGASLALAGLAGCDIRQPRERIVPYVHTPESVTPGLPSYFCTAWEFSGCGVGLVVQSRAGRPVKVEGNPRHPASRGGTGVFVQAATLDLYDPDRARAPSRGGQVTTLEALREYLAAKRSQWDENGGRGLRLLTAPTSSPTFARLTKKLYRRWPNASLRSYEATPADHRMAGNRLAWGDHAADLEPVYKFDRCRVVVSIGDDFLSARDTPPAWITDFSNARRIAGQSDADESADETNGPGDESNGIPDDMLRLYAVDATPTLTTAKADQRLMLTPPAIVDAVRWLAARLGVFDDDAGPSDRLTDPQLEWLERCADDLKQTNDGDKVPLMIAGHGQPPAVHALVHAINDAVGASGHSVEMVGRTGHPPADRPPLEGMIDSLATLTEEMRSGEVESLVILEGNPVFDAPADIAVAEALANVPDSLHLSGSVNETSRHCRWHVPKSHFLESWGDTRAADGTAAVTQPLIEPLYASLTPIELLALLVGDPDDPEAAQNPDPTDPGTIRNGYDLVRTTWQRHRGDRDENFDARWKRWLRRGFIDETDETSAQSAAQPELHADFGNRVSIALEEMSRAGSGTSSADGESGSRTEDERGPFHVLFRPDPTIWDGRFANNGWLQELPKPLSKLTWDNVVWLSLSDAEQLGVASGDLLELSRGERTVTLPAWVMPGQPPETLTVFFGYGRREAGRVASNSGFDAYPLRTSDAMWSAAGVSVRKLGRRYPLASTQHHFLVEGRHLVRSGTLAELQENPDRPDFVHPAEPGPDASFFPDWPEKQSQWGMTIDLTACTGCAACVVACQSENNIPVVGKEEVSRNREMHWLRVDTYYSGPADEPTSTHHQPVPCMHCELAPCEVVCPVAATTHSDDGLNQMIYNRCVGTRYCSNNCPYKVRRFNFFDYAGRFYEEPAESLLANPEVTVRSRGVMEKCTYCVQRIRAAEADAELEGRQLRDGEVVTACQSACPARAIEFGDLSDAQSGVHQRRHHPLNYALLEELNTRPRTTYLAEVKHPAGRDADTQRDQTGNAVTEGSNG